ncbi:MAG: thioredoxin domain-containing protein [Sphingobium sp.]
MKTGFLIATIGLALALSGCGSKDEGNQAVGAPTGAPVAAVAAPKGTVWSETVAATPEGGFRMGNPDAPLKLIEYASFTCPHCAEFAETADEGLRAKVDTGKVSFEFRNLIRDPLDLTAAVLARCGGKDPFLPLAHQMFANQAAMFKTIQGAGDPAYQAAMQAPPNQRLVKLAELAGLIEFVKARGVAEPAARICLSDGAAAEKLANESNAGAEKYTVEGTPTLILNEKKLDNANTWPTLEAALKQAGA